MKLSEIEVGLRRKDWVLVTCPKGSLIVRWKTEQSGNTYILIPHGPKGRWKHIIESETAMPERATLAIMIQALDCAYEVTWQ